MATFSFPIDLGKVFATGIDQRLSDDYRADIDGLRAIAVLSVVLFHLDFVFLSGGYVGVDIFFVISGYLIGKSILDQRRVGTFTLGKFYQKRLRRIIPALIATFTLTTIAAVIVLLPIPLAEYGRELIAAVYSLANVHFFLEADYFAAEAHTKPLLHSWSLGVEEQFYILFPVVLFFTRHTKRFDLWLIGTLAIASFVASAAIQEAHATANFYLIPFRAWELLAGVLAAEWRFRALERALVREVLAVVALAIIAAVCLTYDAQTTFPGVSALPPVLATAVLLNVGAHGRTLSGRLIAIRPAVWIGLISYSLYLWHWPIIVMIKQWLPEAWLRMPHRVIALSLSLFLAWLSWRFVERPFRSPCVSNRTIWWFSGGTAALFTIIGAGLMIGQGFPQRFSARVVQYASYLERPTERSGNGCQIGLFDPPGTFVPDRCRQLDPDKPNVLVVGDSHSSHLMAGLVRRFPEIAFQQTSAAGCPISTDNAVEATPTCEAFRQEFFNERMDDNLPDWVLISQFWGDDFNWLDQTIDFYRSRGLGVIVSGPAARYEVPLPLALARSELRDDPGIVDRMRIPGTKEFDQKLRNFAVERGAIYMSPFDALCPDGVCVSHLVNGEPVQIDSNHFGAGGSFLVAKEFPIEDVLKVGQRKLRSD